MFKRYVDAVLDAAGNAMPGTRVDVVVATTLVSALLYGDAWGTGGTIGSTVYADAKGVVSFYAQDGTYNLTYSRAGIVTDTENDVCVGAGGGYQQQVFIEDPAFQRLIVGGNAQAAFDAAIASFAGGPGAVYFDGNYSVESIVKPNNVSLYATGVTKSSLNQLATGTGPVIWDYPLYGTPDGTGTRSVISGFVINGNDVGIINLTGTVTNGSNVITSPSSLVGLAIGQKVEGVNIPDGTVFTQITPTLQMSNPATGSNSVQNLLTVRPAWQFTATATAGSRLLTITAGNPALIKKGMKLSGSTLQVDGDDLNQHTRCVSVAGSVVTMDRTASTSGSFALTAYLYNSLILVGEPFNNPGYNASWEYRAPKMIDLQLVNAGGDNICVRPGRDQAFGAYIQGKNGNGYGWSMTGSNDSRLFECGFGANWLTSLKIVTCMPRVVAGDYWDPKKCDTEQTILLRKCRESIVSNCDINSTVTVVGYSDDLGMANHFTGCNFKLKASGIEPAGNIAAVITCTDSHVIVTGGCIKADRTTGQAADYIGNTTTVNSHITIDGVVMAMTPVIAADSSATPFKLGVATGIGTTAGRFYDPTAMRLWSYGPRQDRSADYHVVTEAGAWTVPNMLRRQHFTGAASVYSVTLPAAPEDEQELDLTFHSAITTFNLLPNTGQTLNSNDTWLTTITAAPTTIRVQYRLSNTKWYRI